MNQKKLAVHIIGLTPLKMHNVRLANPRDPIVIEMKKITAKKANKTEDDLDRLSDLEWAGGIYTNNNDEPVIPARCILGMVYEAGKKRRKGPKVLSGVACDDDAKLIYKGPKKAAELFDLPEFRDVGPATVQRNKVMRTWPIFRQWESKFTLLVNISVISIDDIRELIDIAGEECGLLDYRPRCGLFMVKAAK